MCETSLTLNEIDAIAQRLDTFWPRTELGNKKDPVDEAVFILLSGQTTETNYVASWNGLRERFTTWDEVANATEEEIFDTIKIGGLGRWKAQQIKRLLADVRMETGSLSLDGLRELGDNEIGAKLDSLSGIGPKSAKCIMMYSFGRQVLPIDTHTERVMLRLGFRPPSVSNRSKAYAQQLEAQVPPHLRHRLHVNLVQHGRAICTARNPVCAKCPLNDICRFGRLRCDSAAAKCDNPEEMMRRGGSQGGEGSP